MYCFLMPKNDYTTRFPSKHATTLAMGHNHATALLNHSEDTRRALSEFRRNLEV